ncbi:MAG: FAD-binding protein, partial [Phycisphaerales bacterium]|nr:FAD-binding protein [Phycisphaerales bacterium]
EIFDICVNQHLGLGGGNMVYLDLTHMSREYLERKLGGILEIYRKFAGDDPCELPMKIFPGVHYSMGGLWTTYTRKSDGKGMEFGAPKSMMTNITGLYAFGEVNYQYHGGTRLGANALLSCIFDGLFCGKGVVNYVRDETAEPAAMIHQGIYDTMLKQEKSKVDALIERAGGENPYHIGIEMGEEMTAASTVVKTEARMQKALTKIQELQDRAENMTLSDTGMWTNQNLSYARALRDMLKLAEVILVGGIERKESRGSHYRTDYPERNDDRFLATTVASYDATTGRPTISWEDIDADLVAPRARTYGAVDKAHNAKTQAAKPVTA